MGRGSGYQATVNRIGLILFAACVTFAACVLARPRVIVVPASRSTPAPSVN